MLHAFRESAHQAIIITGFVFMMMVIIEYINISTGGLWQKKLQGSSWKQYILASFLGIIPGCLGSFTMVTLYTHRVVSFGALVTTMIATSGDAAFVMISLMPKTSLFIFLILFVIGWSAGILTDLLSRRKSLLVPEDTACASELQFHEQEICRPFPWGNLKEQWLHCTPARGFLSLILIGFLFSITTGGHDMENWMKITLVMVGAVTLFIVATVPDHFLETHLWEHLAKIHIPKIFLWTFAAILVMHLLLEHYHLEGWFRDNKLLIIAMACLIGLIPDSGPHLVFLTLFSQGAIPFSVLLANSIVQDGHGMLPLLAEARSDFFKIKLINFAVGLTVGLAGFLTGW